MPPPTEVMYLDEDNFCPTLMEPDGIDGDWGTLPCPVLISLEGAGLEGAGLDGTGLDGTGLVGTGLECGEGLEGMGLEGAVLEGADLATFVDCEEKILLEGPQLTILVGFKGIITHPCISNSLSIFPSAPYPCPK